MELSEQIRRFLNNIDLFSGDIVYILEAFADQAELQEKRIKALEANTSKSVLRRLSHQLGVDMGGYDK